MSLQADYVWQISVSDLGKKIIKRKVIRTTKQHVYVEDFGNAQKLKIDTCFVELERAKEECNAIAQKLIESYQAKIDKLKEGCQIQERVHGVYNEQ